MHLFTPNHVQLIQACYPPSAALLTSGPEYKPNAQELSRLTYYASNKVGKLNKLGGELEKRVKADCRRAQAGNIRARASLLITLAIIRALASECRRDISLLSSPLIVSVDSAISAMPSDLEVIARAASVFTTWTTYTDGHLMGVDSTFTQEYIATLQRFSAMSRVESKTRDHEIRNRTRLIGLAALTGAVTSEALYSASSHFKPQASIIIPALLVTIFETKLQLLEHVAAIIKEKPTSPYLEEFRSRPTIERRAASIHVHVDGDKGPSEEDVANACLRVLSSLLGHSNGAQVGYVMQAAFDSLEEIQGWNKLDHCRWFAQKVADWTQYQYRYAVPTRLVERLLEAQDVPSTTPLHIALAAMVTMVFTSPTPLVNLSTSDIISNLITLTLRRVAIDPDDSTLPALVQCIASLGTHVYYADQIQDLAAELISRLTLVEINGVKGGGKGEKERSRSTAIRCLLAGLMGLMRAADDHDFTDDQETQEQSKPGATSAASTSKALPDLLGDKGHTHVRPSRRTRVSPEIWQDTLTLLCDADFAVRADYALALLSYVKSEIPKRSALADLKRLRPLADGPSRQGSSTAAAVHGDSTSRFLNALHAYLYVLATCSTLGFASGFSPSPSPSTNGDTSLGANGDINVDDSPAQSQAAGRRSMNFAPRQRKASVAQRMLGQAPSRVSATASAFASDYAHILAILTIVHEQLPVHGLLTGVPMLLALDAATQVDDADDDILQLRQEAIKEVVAKVWLVIGKTWDSSELIKFASEASQVPSCLPTASEIKPGHLVAPQECVHLSRGDSSSDSSSSKCLDTEAALTAIIACPTVQLATGLDGQTLLRKLACQWTPESAFKDAVEKSSNYDALRGESVLKISPALMAIENLSLQSLGRFTRGVGVTDLREALEGRSSMSNPALVNKAPSISTLDHASTVLHGDSMSTRTTRPRTKKRQSPGGPGEVRDVLNRLGIGKQNANSLLKASFPSLQKSDARSSPFNPPYKA
ncbi:hypothetical protein JAAARDRAFT_28278 [Jaapia argillacea MUCL 33604]|uniref:Protein EFR3 n=1 Tax=Jaapia argillacea MUCL 33604 TaxID=933084 RepID=A0A067QCF8_9AGAM|nr:hypothetical protein JAAARDRAFT_28278 [Jaapia argillacea MUCL 33604]